MKGGSRGRAQVAVMPPPSTPPYLRVIREHPITAGYVVVAVVGWTVVGILRAAGVI